MRIGVFLNDSGWGAVDHTAMSRGLGGRETALVHLCMEWAKLEHEVWAFVPRNEVTHSLFTGDGPGRPGEVPEGVVHWIPAARVLQVAPTLDLDLFVSWEDVGVFKAFGEASVGRRVVHLQVAHLHSDVPVSSVCDDVAVLSDWAGRFLLTQHPDVKDILHTLPNGVDLSRFENRKWSDKNPQPDNYQFVYSSSPDRGLHHLLLMWPEIRRAVQYEFSQDCELHVAYGLENFVATSRWSHREDAIRALVIEEELDQEGIIYHGRIGQDKLAEILLSADLLTYPADTYSPTETGVIVICEALAAGTPVVTTTCDCIHEDYGEVTTQVDLPLNYKEYVTAIIDTLHEDNYGSQAATGLEFVQSRSWTVIAKQWLEEFNLATV